LEISRRRLTDYVREKMRAIAAYLHFSSFNQSHHCRWRCLKSLGSLSSHDGNENETSLENKDLANMTIL